MKSARTDEQAAAKTSVSSSSSSSSSVPATIPLGGSSLSNKAPTPAFLEKLFDILDEQSPYGNLISWQPDGNSFIIKKVNEFSEVVLPKYFKHSNIQSYIRQLNMYGFSKTRHDSTHREFAHQLFRRGRRDLLGLIKRKSQHSHHPAPHDAVGTALTAQDCDLQSFRVPDLLAPDDAASLLSGGAGIDQSSRIAQLEKKLSTLSSLYFDLAQKHNQLCASLHGGGAAGETDLSEEECEHVRPWSVGEACGHSSGGSVCSLGEPCQAALDGNLLAGCEIDNFAGCALRRMPSLSDGFDEPPRHAMDLAGQPLVRMDTTDSSTTKRSVPHGDSSAGKRARSNYLQFVTDATDVERLLAPTVCPSATPHSAEMAGLDAISVAASMLDTQRRASDDVLAGQYLLQAQPYSTLKRFSSYG